MTTYPLRISCIALGFLGCLMSGCGRSADDRVPVSGRVIIDGQPLTMGTIRFVPESGRPASGAILADGTFELASESVNQLSTAGLSRGKYRVQVSASNVVDDSTIRWSAPARYADFRTSGLDVTIEKPMEDLVIQLTWEGAERPKQRDAAASVRDSSAADDASSQPAAKGAPSSDVAEGGKAI